MIVFRKLNGVISDLRVMPASYVPLPDETALQGDALPDPSTLLTAQEKIDAAKIAKRAQLALACSAQITGGYSSSALATPFTYPGAPTDQANMAASVLDALTARGQVPGWTTLFICRDANGVWARRAHTALQIQKAGQDGKDAVVTALNKLDSLRAKIDAATDVTAVNAIVW